MYTCCGNQAAYIDIALAACYAIMLVSLKLPATNCRMLKPRRTIYPWIAFMCATCTCVA